jgi:hypothetical protein
MARGRFLAVRRISIQQRKAPLEVPMIDHIEKAPPAN